ALPVLAMSAFTASGLAASDFVASAFLLSIFGVSVFTKSFAGSLGGSLATDEIAAGPGSLGAMAAGFSGVDGTAGAAATAATAGGGRPCQAAGQGGACARRRECSLARPADRRPVTALAGPGRWNPGG